MTSRTQRRLLYTILAAYVVLASIYSIVTPIFEASDELWHYPMVKYLADNDLQLPVQDPTVPTAWRQEGSQPPLYYIMAAVLTGGIDTSDLELVRRQNPHADIGTLPPDGNANMITHRADLEAFPWRGTTLAVHIARFLSVALGLGTVIVTYSLALSIFPERPEVALGAAALNAFLPMFLFISGSVNNDNLSNLLGNLLTLLIVRLLQLRTQPSLRMYIAVGIVAGAGLLAKLNIGFLIPIVALALLLLSLRLRSWKPFFVGGLVSGSLTILIASWWYIRNFELYGDPSGLNVFLEIVGRRAIPANAVQLWAERHSFTQAFWGFFGGVNVPLPEGLYLVFNILGGLGLIGAITFIFHRYLRRRWMPGQALPALVTILWSLITFVSYLRWTTETPASQGRLIFGALSSILMWIVVGLTWWQPRQARPLVIIGLVSCFGFVAAITPFEYIRPAYTPITPRLLSDQNSALTTFEEPETDGQVELINAAVITESARPDDYVVLNLVWRTSAPLVRDWSLFVHLVTPDGVIIGQRDIFPGNGLLATSDFTQDQIWQDTIAVYVPPAAYTPMPLTVEIGWYDLLTRERLILPSEAEIFTVGTVELRPLASILEVPNPLSIRFENGIELVGYALSDLSPAAGDSIDLTLYWRSSAPIENDYVVFAHILDPVTTTIYAQSDGQPANWTAPTSTWLPGAVIEDTHTLEVDPNTPPGIYELEIGLYLQTPEGFPRLRVMTPDGGMANDYTYLSRVRVLPREDAP